MFVEIPCEASGLWKLLTTSVGLGKSICLNLLSLLGSVFGKLNFCKILGFFLGFQIYLQGVWQSSLLISFFFLVLFWLFIICQFLFYGFAISFWFILIRLASCSLISFYFLIKIFLGDLFVNNTGFILVLALFKNFSLSLPSLYLVRCLIKFYYFLYNYLWILLWALI